MKDFNVLLFSKMGAWGFKTGLYSAVGYVAGDMYIMCIMAWEAHLCIFQADLIMTIMLFCYNVQGYANNIKY